MPIDESIGRTFGNESLEENFCILGVPKIWAATEPEGHKLSYSFSLKKFLSFNLYKKCYSKASRFKVGY